MREITDRYDVVLFDLGNTLIAQENPGTAFEDMETRWLPGARDVIDSLHGAVPIGIVSNTTYITAAQIAEKLGDAADRFAVIIATAELGAHKPSPAPLLAALDRMGVEPQARVLYVGDRETDLQAARAADVDFAWAGVDLRERLLAHVRGASALERALEGPFEYSPAHEQAVRERFDLLAKPKGSLGRLEDYVCQIAGMRGTEHPTVDPAALGVFVADHGIAADDSVTPWPQAVTSIMRDAVVDGLAAVSVLARNADLFVEVVDVGTIDAIPCRKARDERITAGTTDLRSGATMTREQAIEALETGARTAERLIAGGSRLLATGEVGMGNTTAAAAIIAYCCEVPAARVTGRGSGVDDETLARKTSIVANAVGVLPEGLPAVDVLAAVGGLEIAAMAGFILGGASVGVPVLLDGVITQAAALIAQRIDDRVGPFLIASHSSAEPGSVVALQGLDLRAVLDLDLRLGEGTGAALALPLLRGASATFNEMALITDLLG